MKNKFLPFLLIIPVFALAACTGMDNTPTVQYGNGNGSPGGNMGGGSSSSSDSYLEALLEETLGRFKQYTFNDENTGGTMGYNLLIPEGYDADGSTKYPLVLFMADMSTCGTDVKKPLTQGYGALVFATDSDQKKHPSFVLVPNYSKQAVDDNWNKTDEVDMTIRLLQKIMSEYHVDADRVYTTGQSMGGMMSFYFNAAYPDIFAASLFVSSQWNIDDLKDFHTKKFFYIVAGGDEKASKGMSSLRTLLADNGAAPAEATWSATLADSAQEANCNELIAKGNTINFITFTAGTVLENGGNSEHMASFNYAYKLTPVRDWLFQQKKSD